MAEHTPSAAQGDIDDELRPYRHGYVMAPTGESYVVHRDASSSSSDAPTRSPSSSPSHRSDPRGKRREPGSSQDYHDDDEKQQQQDHRPAQDYYDGHHEYDDWPLFDDDPWEGGTLPDAPDTTVTAAASSPDLDPDTWRAATVSFLQRELRRVTRQRDEAHRRLDKLLERRGERRWEDSERRVAELLEQNQRLAVKLAELQQQRHDARVATASDPQTWGSQQ